MNSPGRALASLRVTLAGMILLAVGAALSYDNPAATPIWVLVVPLLLLSLNLMAAIATNPRINRRPGLLIFHVALLGICVLAAIGRMARYEAHVEMLEGTAFSAEHVLDVSRGPLHWGELDKVRFIQGPYTVDYAAQLTRGPTRSQVWLPDGQGGWESRVVGDDRPLIVDGYRFYTSFNKGFAVILTWVPQGGAPVTGSVHMPSYPLFEHKQDNTWTPPGGAPVKFWLRLDTGLRQDGAWMLDAKRAKGTLVVYNGDVRSELAPGEAVALPGGTLRYDRLSTWMGYKIFYDPTLHALFFVSILGVLGLGAHFWRRFGAPPASAKHAHEGFAPGASVKQGMV